MTSTNDGKDVKSNQTSGPKGKLYYIELYKSLEAGLNKECDLSERTQQLCEAWRCVHTLWTHSHESTHPVLLNWLHRHTARIVFQSEWAESRDEQRRFEEVIDAFIAESESCPNGVPPWAKDVVARGKLFKKILANPWGHPVLRLLLDPGSRKSPKDEEVLEWLKDETGVMFVTRLRHLASSKHCQDLALSLATSIMDRIRAGIEPTKDEEAADTIDNQNMNMESTFLNVIKSEAEFKSEMVDFITDVEFVLLYKQDDQTCIKLAKDTPLSNVFELLDRLRKRLDSSPWEKKLWKNAKEVATLIAQVVITRCMVVPVCTGRSRKALYWTTRALVRLVSAPRLPAAAASLAAPAATARHLHTLATAVDVESKGDMKPFVCELYVRAITAGMNELERLKLNPEKEPEARLAEKMLSEWLMQLGQVLSASDRMHCECILTAFSVHPTPSMYERIKTAPDLPPITVDIEPSAAPTTSDFGSWANDSRSQTNFVKTSETLNLKQTQNQANVLSTAIVSEGEGLGLSTMLCQDITVLLSGPRVKTLSWDMDRELLLDNCRTYMERTNYGTRTLTTELKYLNLDLRKYQHLPEEEDDDGDLYYGIEKGYEHLVELQQPEEIWNDAEDLDRTESAQTTDVHSDPFSNKTRKKPKKIYVSSDDEDLLTAIEESKNLEKKKERPHSKERKERKSRTKKKLKDPLDLSDNSVVNKDDNINTKSDHSEKRNDKVTSQSADRKKDKDPERKKIKNKEKKERKERKRKHNMLQDATKSVSLSSLVGMKVTNLTNPIKQEPVSNSDNLSHVTSSVSAATTESNVIFDGIFPMDKLKTQEKITPKSNDVNPNEKVIVKYNDMDRLEVNRHKPSLQYNNPNTVTQQKIDYVSETVKNSISKLIQFRRQKSANENREQSASLKPSLQSLIYKNVKPQIAQNFISNQYGQCKKPTSETPSDVNNILNNKDNAFRSVIQFDQNRKPSINNNAIPTGTKVLSYTMDRSQEAALTSKVGQKKPKTSACTDSQTQKHVQGHQNNYIEFVKELQRSLNAGVHPDYDPTPTKKEIKPMSRVNPVVPKSEPKLTQSAKFQTIKSDNAPNTFSRLNYYKTNDIKSKQIVENQSLKINPPNTADLDKMLAEQRAIKRAAIHSPSASVINQAPAYSNVHQNVTKSLYTPKEQITYNSGASGLQSDSANSMRTQSKQYNKVNIERPYTPVTVPNKLTYLTEKDQQDLLLLLRQQSKQNLTRPVANTLKERVSYPLTSTSNALPINNNQTSVIKRLIDETAIKNINKSNSNQQVPRLDYSNEVKLQTMPLKAKTDLSHSKNVDDKYNKIQKAEVINNEGRTMKLGVKYGETGQDDWKSVLQDILKHKTPNRGPNALDVALRSDTNMNAFDYINQKQNIAKTQVGATGQSVISTIQKGNVVHKKQEQCLSNNETKTSVLKVPKPDIHIKNIQRNVSKDRQLLKNPAVEVRLNPEVNHPYKTDLCLNREVAQTTAAVSKPLHNIKPLSKLEQILSNNAAKSESREYTSLLKCDNQKKIMTDNKPTIMNSESRRMPSELNRQSFVCPPSKEEDPFISGVPNSDYDLIDALMDDDLRQEIGELSSDEDNYTKPTLCKKISNPYIDANKNVACAKQNNQGILSPLLNSRHKSTLKQSTETIACKTPININLNTAIPVEQSGTSANVKINTNRVEYPAERAMPNISKITNTINAVPTFVAIPQQMPVQKVMLIRPEIVYKPHIPATVQNALAQPALTALLNRPPNIGVYNATHIDAPVINPIIVANVSRPAATPIIAAPAAPIIAPTVRIAKPVIDKRPEVSSTGGYNSESKEIKSIINDAQKGPLVNIESANCIKSSERKVLSEVQEKQEFSMNIKKMDPNNAKCPSDSFELVFKDPADQQRLDNKRKAILNRNINHRTNNKPIALSYTPLHNKTSEIDKTENSFNLNSSAKRSITSNENKKMASLLNVKVKTMPDIQISKENFKENKNLEGSCRRILLRSSNSLSLDNTQEAATVVVATKKTKTRANKKRVDLKVAASPPVDKIQKIKKRRKPRKPKEILETKKVEKRITRQTSKTDIGFVNNTELKVEQKNTVINSKNVDTSITTPEIVDIEDQLVGAMILKTSPSKSSTKTIGTMIKDDDVTETCVDVQSDDCVPTNLMTAKDYEKTNDLKFFQSENDTTSVTETDVDVQPALDVETDTVVKVLESQQPKMALPPTLDQTDVNEKLITIKACVKNSKIKRVIVDVPLQATSNIPQQEPVDTPQYQNKLSTTDSSKSCEEKVKDNNKKLTGSSALENINIILPQKTNDASNGLQNKLLTTSCSKSLVDKLKNNKSLPETSAPKNINIIKQKTHDVNNGQQNKLLSTCSNKSNENKHKTLTGSSATENMEVKIPQKTNEVKNGQHISNNKAITPVRESLIKGGRGIAQGVKPLPLINDQISIRQPSTTIPAVTRKEVGATQVKDNSETANSNCKVREVICLDNDDNTNSQTENTNRQNTQAIPQSFLDDIKIEHVASDTNDPLKKSVRIKLPNGKVFRATIRGQDVNVNTLFADPKLKTVFLQNISNKNPYTLNIKQLSISNKCQPDIITETRIQNISVRVANPIRNSMETINLLSDEEADDDDPLYMDTEFGKYKIPLMDRKLYENHQVCLSKKCIVKLKRETLILPDADNTILIPDDDGLESVHIKHAEPEVIIIDTKTTDCLSSEIITTDFISTHEIVLPNRKDAIEKLLTSLPEGIIAKKFKPVVSEVIEIDDSSNDESILSDLNQEKLPVNTCNDKIQELKNLLLKDLGISNKAINKSGDSETPDIKSLKSDLGPDALTLSLEQEKTTNVECEQNSCKEASKYLSGDVDCCIKLTKCDSLVSNYTNLKECYVKLFRCDEYIPDNVEIITSTSSEVEVDPDYSLFIEDTMSDATLSRSGSFSILNDFNILDQTFQDLNQCTSPVMEAYDSIAALKNKDDKVNIINEGTILCETDWLMSKLETNLLWKYITNNHYHNDTKNNNKCEDSITIAHKNSTLSHKELGRDSCNYRTSKYCVPKLITLVTKLIQNIPIIDKLKPLCVEIPTSNASPLHSLKRKLMDKSQVVAKISKTRKSLKGQNYNGSLKTILTKCVPSVKRIITEPKSSRADPKYLTQNKTNANIDIKLNFEPLLHNYKENSQECARFIENEVVASSNDKYTEKINYNLPKKSPEGEPILPLSSNIDLHQNKDTNECLDGDSINSISFVESMNGTSHKKCSNSIGSTTAAFMQSSSLIDVPISVKNKNTCLESQPYEDVTSSDIKIKDNLTELDSQEDNILYWLTSENKREPPSCSENYVETKCSDEVKHVEDNSKVHLITNKNVEKIDNIETSLSNKTVNCISHVKDLNKNDVNICPTNVTCTITEALIEPKSSLAQTTASVQVIQNNSSCSDKQVLECKASNIREVAKYKECGKLDVDNDQGPIECEIHVDNANLHCETVLDAKVAQDDNDTHFECTSDIVHEQENNPLISFKQLTTDEAIEISSADESDYDCNSRNIEAVNEDQDESDYLIIEVPLDIETAKITSAGNDLFSSDIIAQKEILEPHSQCKDLQEYDLQRDAASDKIQKQNNNSVISPNKSKTNEIILKTKFEASDGINDVKQIELAAVKVNIDSKNVNVDTPPQNHDENDWNLQFRLNKTKKYVIDNKLKGKRDELFQDVTKRYMSRIDTKEEIVQDITETSVENVHIISKDLDKTCEKTTKTMQRDDSCNDKLLEVKLAKIVMGTALDEYNDLVEILDDHTVPISIEFNDVEGDQLALTLRDSDILHRVHNKGLKNIVKAYNEDVLERELSEIVMGKQNKDSKIVTNIFNEDTSPFHSHVIENDRYDRDTKIKETECKKCPSASGSFTDENYDFGHFDEDILQITQDFDENGEIKDIEITLKKPEITYSRSEKNSKTRNLKRKSDMTDPNIRQKKYRKGKLIDATKLTADALAANSYCKEFRRLFNYCSSVKFSYAIPFHKEYIDVNQCLTAWPIEGNCNIDFDSHIDDNLFTDTNGTIRTIHDPLQQTLAEEISAEYNESQYSSQDITETNFQMGFGEESGRVIQNLQKYNSLNISAATLSDVKQNQPLLLSENDILEDTINELQKDERYYRCFHLKSKVRSFFYKTMMELSEGLIKENFKEHDIFLTSNDKFNFPFGLNLPNFIEPPRYDICVQVVQIGQLPVSASSQNAMTCDPRVTQVSNASPSQCSAENSLNDESHSPIKTEYTELTTADIRLPLQDYAQHHNQLPVAEDTDSLLLTDVVIENIKEEIKEEVKEEPEVNDDINEDYGIVCNDSYHVENNSFSENVVYSYDANPLPAPTSENNADMMLNSTEKQSEFQTILDQQTQQSNQVQITSKVQFQQVNPLTPQSQEVQDQQQIHQIQHLQHTQQSHHPQQTQLAQQPQHPAQQQSQQTHHQQQVQQAQLHHIAQQSQNVQPLQQNQHQGLSEKSDQIAHAMSAAGITTGTESVPTSRAHAIVNIISQKIRQGSTVVTNPSMNSYPKTTQINAMALQQALAQILPPPLSHTNANENNQQNTSNPSQVTPQVLHIVQSKNGSGNQFTLVDNSPHGSNSAPSATPVLHIVQNKGNTTVPTSNGTTSQGNSFNGLSLMDSGLQQGNQLLHIVNTGNQKNGNSGQILRKVNLLTNLANVQGANEQKMLQFVCKSADGKAIQLNASNQRSMVLRLQPVESPNLQQVQSKTVESKDLSPRSSTPNNVPSKENSQQEIKSRSVYEENYAKFIQSSNKTIVPEKATSLPKFGQAFGKQVFQEGTQKNDLNNSNCHLPSSSENPDCHANDNAVNLEHINQLNSPPLLLRKSPQTSQAQTNLVQQLKQTIAPMSVGMHGGVIYTRQIPVNIGGGQTINLITVPSTDLVDESGSKHQVVSNQEGIEPSIIKLVPQSSASNSENYEENNSHSISNDNSHTQQQPVLTQMRIKLPMLSKTPQMVGGARLVRPSFFQIQRNVIGGANQPVYQQLVLTAAPPLGQQTVRLPQTQLNKPVKVQNESQSSPESQMSSSTLEQLREFDLVLEQVKERSTGTATSVPSATPTSNSFTGQNAPSKDTTDSAIPASTSQTQKTQQVLYTVGNTPPLGVTYVNKKTPVTMPTLTTTSSFVRSPDSSEMESPTSSTQQPARTATNTPSASNQITTNATNSNNVVSQSQSKPPKPKPKPRPKAASNPPNTLKLPPVPPKTSTQKPAEDEQTTQRILYILAEYKEQVENSPDKNKPAPRRRTNLPSNPGCSSKRKKCSGGSRRSGRDMSPCHGEDTCRTMGSEDSSCGTSQGDCNESCIDSHSPQDSPRKVVRKLTFENETSIPIMQPRPQPQRNVIVADGQTITVARGTAGKPATAVLMPANYILPVSMVKGGQQIAIVTNRGPKLLTVGGGEGGTTNALLLQRLIGPAGLKPVLTRPGVRHVRLPTSALHNLQAFNLATTTTTVPPAESSASSTTLPNPPDLIDTRAASSPWRTERDSQDMKPERGSSPEGSEPWHLPPSDYCYEETVRAENMDRTVLVVHKKDGSSHRQHRLTHVSAAALRHKYAILEHELRLQKSLSEECEDLGVDSPSASELFPEAELLFAASPAHDHTQEHIHHSHTPQPSHSGIPQPDMDDQIATDQLLRSDMHDDRDLGLGLEDVGIVTVSEDGMQATIQLDQEEFARSHPNTTFHREPTDEEEIQHPFTLSNIKGRHITSTIFHANRQPGTVLMSAPQTTVISQAIADNSNIHQNTIKYSDLDNMINSIPGSQNNNVNLSSVLVKEDGLSRFDSLLDSRELHLSNTASTIVHSSGHTTQVIRRVCYEDDKQDRDHRYLMDESDGLIAGDDAKMMAEDSSRDATLESMGDTTGSSPERNAEMFWESNSASGRADFSSDSDKCCKSPSDDTSTDSSAGVSAHMRLDSVIKEARGLASDDDVPPLRTYPAPRSLSGKTAPSADDVSGRRRASGRGVVKRGTCLCCVSESAPTRPKKPRQRRSAVDFAAAN